jgi:hypothetical protein
MKAKLSLLAAAACALLLVLPVGAKNPPVTATIPGSATRGAWPAETLSGKITMVDPVQKIVVVQSNGVPYDLMVTSRTKIESGGQTMSLDGLSSDINQGVSVRFTPERRGDVASSITIGG